MAKHAKKTAAAAIARTGARTTASVAVAAAGLLALSGVANAGGSKGDDGSMIQNTEVDGGGGGDQGNSADGLIPILNNNDIAVNANICDVLNGLNVDVIEVLSDLDLDLLSETNGGDDATVSGDTACGNSSEQNDTNTSIKSIEVDGKGAGKGGKK